jgi:hypothetical protein
MATLRRVIRATSGPLYGERSAECSVRRAVFGVRCAECSVRRAVFGVQCSACEAQRAVCAMQSAVWCAVRGMERPPRAACGLCAMAHSVVVSTGPHHHTPRDPTLTPHGTPPSHPHGTPPSHPTGPHPHTPWHAQRRSLAWPRARATSTQRATGRAPASRRWRASLRSRPRRGDSAVRGVARPHGVR